MKFRNILKMTTCMAVAATVISVAHGQSANTETAPAPAAEEEKVVLEEIIVTGFRASIASSDDRKRNAKQIVDSIVSEDVGKLPDNNVPEALARVTGVQITRERGQGQSVSIRGMGEMQGLETVQTTINGNSTSLGEARSINLADIPAELIKAIDVYKTRTPDQVEGGIAGTVNIEYRRPLEMKDGLTVAGSLRGSYDENSEKVSPYGSLLIADRFDTEFGEVGLLLNGSMTRTNYKETYIDSESPDLAEVEGDTNSAWGRLPSNLKNIVIPYRTQYGVESGHVDRPSINGVIQWKPTSELSFLLEGGYNGTREKRQVDKLYSFNRAYLSTLTNISLQPDGQTVNSVTINQSNGVPAGIDSIYQSISSNLYTSNFEARWESDPLTVTASAQYNKSNTRVYNVETITRLNGLQSATVDFLSDLTDRKAPVITLNGTDLSNLDNYRLERFQDLIERSTNEEYAGQTDATLRVSNDWFVRTIQAGIRYSTRDTNRNYGYRDGLPLDSSGNMFSLSAIPGGTSAALTGTGISGSQEWYRIPGSVVLSNIASILDFVSNNDARNSNRFKSKYPSSDRGQLFDSTESRFSYYGTVNYAFDLGVPVDGHFGVRATRTWGDTQSYSYRLVSGSEVVEESFGKGDYWDYLPSASANFHVTDEALVRLAYSTDVSRPSFYDLRSFYWVDPAATNPTVDAGNPDLKASRSKSYDITAEYYYGRGGAASIGAYYKTSTNFLYYSSEAVTDLTAYGVDAGKSGFVRQLRNAGDGKFIGIEGKVRSFFDFLPGFWSNFGAELNASRVIKARVEYPYEEDFPGAFDVSNASKWTGNATLYYDTPEFSARLALNYRSAYRMDIWPDYPEYSPYMNDTYRLDAAVNYTPVEYATLSLEATNLTNEKDYTYFGKKNLLPRGVRVPGRTIQTSIRFRF
jgi:TonB-dependent receptor